MTITMPELKSRAAQRFKVYRDVSGLSQEALAKDSGVSVRTIINLESGQRVPSVEILTKLSEPLKVHNLAAKLLEEGWLALITELAAMRFPPCVLP